MISKNIVLYTCLLFGLNMGITHTLVAQDLQYSKKIIRKLCSKKYKGRGYVGNGVNKAATFLVKKIRQTGLKKFSPGYTQEYYFGVNTHPTAIRCKVDGKKQIAGHDFLVSASSPGVEGKYKLLHYNIKDSSLHAALYNKIRTGFAAEEALVLHFSSQRNNRFVDSMRAQGHWPALIIFTEEKKLTHTIAHQVDPYPGLVFIDSAIAGCSKIDISFQHKFQPSLRNQNIVAYLEGSRSDSFLVFTAHYDHLGMMGKAMFPGASDNASGTSMILYLAKYFSTHKPPFNMVFILFSGEEAGLLGSDFFTTHPLFDISRIKMLVNIDIMGDARNGITVVNGEVFRPQFDRLQQINTKKKYLPDVKIRGKAKNSDHYHFSEKGIPAFFIYSMGGAGFYHDVFDKANTLTLQHYEQVARLLIDFVEQ